jgi:hypothetical protein
MTPEEAWASATVEFFKEFLRRVWARKLSFTTLEILTNLFPG